MGKLKRLKKQIRSVASAKTKISEILWDFAGDYFGRGRNLQERRQLLKIAVLAWNISLLPAEGITERINEVVFNLKKMNPSQENIDDKMALFKKDLAILVARKRELFPKIIKYIVEATIEEADGKEQILAVSARFDKK